MLFRSNLSFGVPEYIDIKDAKYDPAIGIMGLQVCVTFMRPGFRIKNRKLKQKKLPKKHQLSKEEAMDFIKTKFSAKIIEE